MRDQRCDLECELARGAGTGDKHGKKASPRIEGEPDEGGHLEEKEDAKRHETQLAQWRLLRAPKTAALAPSAGLVEAAISLTVMPITSTSEHAGPPRGTQTQMYARHFLCAPAFRSLVLAEILALRACFVPLGWKIGENQSLGRSRVRWRWRRSACDGYQA